MSDATRITRVRDARTHSGPEKDGELYFHVYRSPKDGKILGYTIGSQQTGERSVGFIGTDSGVPVEQAWENAKGLAKGYGCSELLVYDPDDLFPAAA